MPLARPRNDLRQYDDLMDEWWRPRGAFCALHWLASARADLIPPGDGHTVLVDVACGGGLMAPMVAAKGYRHIGVDLVASGLLVARDHGVLAVHADALRLPIATAAADVVVAGEILEHVREPELLVREAARVLRRGGLFICDSLAPTRLSKFLMVTVAERLPFVPAGIHDPDLFVDPVRIVRACASAGIDLQVRGLRPALVEALAWLAGRGHSVTMRPTGFTGIVWQGLGVRRGPA